MGFIWIVRKIWKSFFTLGILLVFFILGCSHQIKIEPNNFPEMKYGEKYDNRIEIEKLNIFGELVIKTDLPDN